LWWSKDLKKGSDVCVVEFGTRSSCFGVVSDVHSTALCPGSDAAEGVGKDGFDCLIANGGF